MGFLKSTFVAVVGVGSLAAVASAATVTSITFEGAPADADREALLDVFGYDEGTPIEVDFVANTLFEPDANGPNIASITAEETFTFFIGGFAGTRGPIGLTLETLDGFCDTINEVCEPADLPVTEALRSDAGFDLGDLSSFNAMELVGGGNLTLSGGVITSDASAVTPSGFDPSGGLLDDLGGFLLVDFLFEGTLVTARLGLDEAVPPAAVPVPPAMALFLTGAAGLAVRRARR